MKNLLFVFAKVFGNSVVLRFRPHTFTEPSRNGCFLGTETRADYRLTREWVVGNFRCGMVDPKVLSNWVLIQKNIQDMRLEWVLKE